MPVKLIYKRILCFCTILLLAAASISSISIKARGNQVTLTTTEEQGDLTVLFTFDKEVVDIVFISPSGEKKYSSDADVEYSCGELWSTYRIKNAEAGEWSVEYVLGSNSEINYSIIQDDYGLWLQYVNVNVVSDDKVSVAFEADCEDDIYYNYEIYAISTTYDDVISKVADGRATANENVEVELDLSRYSSDSYVFRVDVFYEEADGELFDNLTSDTYEYINKNQPDAIENFEVRVDRKSLFCDVDWEQFSVSGCDSYRLVVKADGNVIYKSDRAYNETNDTVGFDTDTKSLEISLAYEKNGIFSAFKTKNISLMDEELNTSADEITGFAQIDINYKVNKERILYVNINELDNEYKISGEGMLAFDLVTGSNSVYAQMELDDLVYLIIDTDIYYDQNPPQIILFDNLDGKTLYTENVTIIGKMTGGSVLKIDGEEVSLEEDGTFSCEFSLSDGENVITLEAEDATGNTSSRVITLYKKSNSNVLIDSENKVLSLIPLFATLSVSVIIIVFALIFMKNKDKKERSKRITVLPFIMCNIVLGIVAGGFLRQYIIRYKYNNSTKYLELAEQSASKASRYLELENSCRIGTIIGGTFFVISILATILFVIIRKRDKADTIDFES